MRAVLVVYLVALCATAVLSTCRENCVFNAFQEETKSIAQECIDKLNMTREEVKSPNKTEEQIDCLYECFMQGTSWLTPEGRFNPDSLQNQTLTRQNLALSIVDLCTEYTLDHPEVTCAFPGCLRKHRLALAYTR